MYTVCVLLLRLLLSYDSAELQIIMTSHTICLLIRQTVHTVNRTCRYSYSGIVRSPCAAEINTFMRERKNNTLVRNDDNTIEDDYNNSQALHGQEESHGVASPF